LDSKPERSILYLRGSIVADSYYRTIKGKQYDRSLLDIVERAAKRSKAPLNKNIAKSLLNAIIDGGEYTDIEKRTVKHIRDNFNFSVEADEYLRTEIRKWAAKISVPVAKKNSKSTTKAAAKKRSAKATSSIELIEDKEESDDTYYHVYDNESEEEIEPTPEYNELVELNRYGQKSKSSFYLRYVFIAILIVILVCFIFIFRSCRTSSKPLETKPAESTKQGLSRSELQKPSLETRELLLPHTEIEKGQVTIQFKKRADAIRYINELKIGFIKQTLNVSPEAANQIATLASALKNFPEIKIRVKGHTCFIGELDENKILSEERARLIKDELVKNGVNVSQMDIRGFGETTNIDSNYTESGRIRNRRVDFSVLSLE